MNHPENNFSQGDFVMLGIEKEFIQRLTKNAFSWKHHESHTVANVYFDTVLANLWFYYEEKGGKPEDFIKMMQRQARRIS